MKSKYEKLSHIQLQQKIIHLESQLSYYRSNKEKQEQNCLEQIAVLRIHNERLRTEIHELLEDNEKFNARTG